MNFEIPDFDEIEFEKNCPCCQGTKVYTKWVPIPRERYARGRLKPERMVPVEEECTYCDSNGIALTSIGEKLLKFIKKYGGQPGA